MIKREEEFSFRFFRNLFLQKCRDYTLRKRLRKYVLFPFSVKHLVSLSLIILEKICKNSYTVG